MRTNTEGERTREVPTWELGVRKKSSSSVFVDSHYATMHINLYSNAYYIQIIYIYIYGYVQCHNEEEEWTPPWVQEEPARKTPKLGCSWPDVDASLVEALAGSPLVIEHLDGQKLLVHARPGEVWDPRDEELDHKCLGFKIRLRRRSSLPG